MTNEVWKNLSELLGEEYSNYEVSSLGRMKRLTYEVTAWNRYQMVNRILPEKLMSVSSRDQDGYVLVSAKKKSFRFHRLLCGLFIPNPDNLPVVNHINGIKDDNRLINLEWNSLEQNASHAIMNRLCKGPRGTSNGNFKYSDEIAISIVKDIDLGISYDIIQEKYKVSKSYLSSLHLGEVRSNVTGRPYRGRTKEFHGLNINEVDKPKDKK